MNSNYWFSVITLINLGSFPPVILSKVISVQAEPTTNKYICVPAACRSQDVIKEPFGVVFVILFSILLMFSCHWRICITEFYTTESVVFYLQKDEPDAFKELGTGNRIATWLFYVSYS